MGGNNDGRERGRGREDGGIREGRRKEGERGGGRGCLQIHCPFDLCTLSIWSRLRCCLSLGIVS